MGNVTFISRKEFFRICQTSFFFLQALLFLKGIFLQKIQSRRLLLEHRENTFLLCRLVDHPLFLFFPLPPSPSGFHNCVFSCYPLSCWQHIVAIASSLPRSPHMLVSLKTRFSWMLFSLYALSLYVPYMPMVSITIYIRVSQSVVPGTAYIGIMRRAELNIQVPWFYQRPIHRLCRWALGICIFSTSSDSAPLKLEPLHVSRRPGGSWQWQLNISIWWLPHTVVLVWQMQPMPVGKLLIIWKQEK